MTALCIGCGEPGAGAGAVPDKPGGRLCPACRARVAGFLDGAAKAFNILPADLSIVGVHATGGVYTPAPRVCPRHGPLSIGGQCPACNTEAVDRLNRGPGVISIEVRNNGRD